MENFVNELILIITDIRDGKLSENCDDSLSNSAYHTFNKCWRRNNDAGQKTVTLRQYSIFQEMWYILEHFDPYTPEFNDVEKTWKDVRDKAAIMLKLLEEKNVNEDVKEFSDWIQFTPHDNDVKQP